MESLGIEGNPEEEYDSSGFAALPQSHRRLVARINGASLKLQSETLGLAVTTDIDTIADLETLRAKTGVPK